MGKMVTKVKKVDGNILYYRADADEPDEKYEPPSPPMTEYERDCLMQSLAVIPHSAKTPTDDELCQYLVSLQMDFVMNPIDINRYANHIAYNGHNEYYYIEPQLCCVTRNEFYLTARAIKIKDGEFVVKKTPTMGISSSGSYNISREPFDLMKYPIRWEK